MAGIGTGLIAMAKRKENAIYGRIREILESARAGVARTVNTTQVMANWLIGREIVEEEQRGTKRAGYGQELLRQLSSRLRKEFGSGFSVDNLELFRAFFLEYPILLSGNKSDAVRRISSASISDTPCRISRGEQESDPARGKPAIEKGHALRGLLGSPSGKTGARDQVSEVEISNAPRAESWQPGTLHPNLSWTHYRRLLRLGRNDARAFYEIEAIKNNWSARELERQINSLLYERLAKSRDKAGLMRLATKGHEIQKPEDVFKDPVVIEFLGLPESHRLVESNLEEALITNLQLFLLELGKGFAFVSRQERITLEGDHFYIDLVFYHTVLKCYVLIDLKVGKLTHADLGQVQLYVNYFDRERRTAGDQPTLGLILCTDKNEAVVKYTLSPEQEKKIFASRYKLHLPSEAELKAELRRELKELTSP
jgi:predicted nuclease of restriction endonuclease-like (RecB) superfamily